MGRPKKTDTIATSTKILDLDKLDSPIIVIKLGGKEHPLKMVSVRDFVDNTVEAEAMRLEKTSAVVSLKDEIGAVIKMLSRTFPSMSEDDWWDMDLVKLYMILDFAKKHNGTNEVIEEAAEVAPANPPSDQPEVSEP